MKMQVPRAVMTPDVNTALDRLLTEMVIAFITRERAQATVEPPAGSNRDLEGKP